jgi:hypothetical protein
MNEVTFWDRVRWFIGRFGYKIILWSEQITYEQFVNRNYEMEVYLRSRGEQEPLPPYVEGSGK